MDRGVVVVLATLTVIAALLARAGTAMIGEAVAPSPRGAEHHAVRTEPRSGRADREALGCAILARNAFDSSTGAIDCMGEDAAPHPETGEVAPTETPSCDASMRLVATYVERDGEESRVALIRDATGSSLLYSPGMSIGEQLVVSIEREAVALRRNDLDCTLALFDHAPSAPLARTIVPTAPELPPPSVTSLAGTRVVGDRLQVTSDFITRAFADPMSIAGSLRAFPVADGLRLAGIGREHPLAQLGVRDGDIIRALDGTPLDGPDAYLTAFSAIRRTGAHSVELSRHGQTLQVGIDVER